MGQPSIRQEARRTALEVQSTGAASVPNARTVSGELAVRVLVAIRERDAAVADADRRAGKALREMTEDEGLSVREAVEWCGEELTTREVTRLRRLVEDGDVGHTDLTCVALAMHLQSTEGMMIAKNAVGTFGALGNYVAALDQAIIWLGIEDRSRNPETTQADRETTQADRDRTQVANEALQKLQEDFDTAHTSYLELVKLSGGTSPIPDPSQETEGATGPA